MKKLLSLLQISLVLSLANPFITNARDLTWTGAASGNWNDSANFSPMFVPTANDTVTIDAGTNHPQLTANVTLYRLVLLNDTFDLNGYQLNVSNDALFSGGWLVNGQLNCRGAIATFAGTVMDATIDVDCTTLELNGSVFNQSCYFKVETGESQGGNTFMAPVSLVHVGTVASISMAMDQGDTFHDSLYVNNTSDGNIHLTQADTSHFKNCIHLASTGDGSIHFGREGGISLLETDGHLVVENGEFTSGQLFIKNIEQQNSTGHRMVLTGTGSSDGHSLLALENCHFTGDVDFAAPNLLLSRNRFEGTAQFAKTGGYDNISKGDNLFSGDASFTNSSTTGHLLLTGSRDDRFLGTAQFTSGSMRVISGYGATAVFEGDVVVNSATVGFYRLKFTGEAEQTLGGTTGHLYGETELDKASGSLTATIPIAIDRRLTFTKGNLKTDSVNLITFLAGATASGATDSSFVSGPVKKVGNTAFEFPVGKDGHFRPIGISAPDSVTDAFVGEYFAQGQEFGDLMDSTLLRLSTCNYWYVTAVSGNANINYSLTWNSNYCWEFDTTYMTVASFHDGFWNNLGRSAVDGNILNGRITSNITQTRSEPLTLALNSMFPSLNPDLGLVAGFGILSGDSVFSNSFHIYGKIGAVGVIDSTFSATDSILPGGIGSVPQALNAMQVVMDTIDTYQGTTLNNDLTNIILFGGIYNIAGNTILDGPMHLYGDSTSVFIFKIGDSLLIQQDADLNLHGVHPQNIYWKVDSHSWLQSDNNFYGILLTTSATVEGILGGQLSILSDHSVNIENTDPANYSKFIRSQNLMTKLNPVQFTTPCNSYNYLCNTITNPGFEEGNTPSGEDWFQAGIVTCWINPICSGNSCYHGNGGSNTPDIMDAGAPLNNGFVPCIGATGNTSFVSFGIPENTLTANTPAWGGSIYPNPSINANTRYVDMYKSETISGSLNTTLTSGKYVFGGWFRSSDCMCFNQFGSLNLCVALSGDQPLCTYSANIGNVPLNSITTNSWEYFGECLDLTGINNLSLMDRIDLKMSDYPSSHSSCGFNYNSGRVLLDDLELFKVADAGPDQITCSNATIGPGCENPQFTYLYTWSVVSGPGSTPAQVMNPVVSPSGTTTYLLHVEINGPNGFWCSDDDEVTVFIVNNLPVVLNANSSCNGSGGSISTTIPSGTPPYQYLWNTGSTAANLTNLQNGTYTVTVTDANGCSGTQSATINNQNMAFTLTGDFQNCQYSDDLCFAISNYDNTQSGNYQWSVSVNNNPPPPVLTVYPFTGTACADFDPGVTGTVTVTYSAPGCTLQSSLPIVLCCEISGTGTEIRDHILSSELLVGTILGVTDVNGVPHIDAGSNPFLIQKTITLNTDMVIEYSPNVIFGPGGGIIIPNGYTLHILNSTLQGCDYLWKGISVQNGGFIETFSTTFMDAQFAVNAENEGNYRIRSSTFTNNHIGVRARGSNYVMRIISAALFEGPGPLLPDYPGQTPASCGIGYAGVHAIDVASVLNIGINPFSVDITFRDLVYGIFSESSNINVVGCTFENIETTPVFNSCFGNAQNANGSGIFSLNRRRGPRTLYQRGFGMTGPVSFQNSRFGIFTRRTISDVQQNSMADNLFGIRAFSNYHGSLTHFKNNKIRSFQQGINIIDPQPLSTTEVFFNEVYLDPGFISGVMTGISTSHNYGGPGVTEIYENTITINGSHQRGISNTGTSANRNSIIRNDITFSTSSSLHRGIFVEKSPDIEVKCNTITGSSASTDGIGVQVTASPLIRVECNTTDDTRFGIRFDGMNNAADFKTNSIGNHQIGFYLNNALIDVQIDKGNQWTGTPYGLFGAFASPLTNTFASQFFVFDPANPPHAGSTGGLNPVQFLQGCNTTNCYPTCNMNLDCSPIPLDAETRFMTRLDSLVALDSLYFDQYHDQFVWSLKRNLYRKLLQDEALMEGNDVFETFFENSEGTSYQVAAKVLHGLSQLPETGGDEIGIIKSKLQISDSLKHLVLVNDSIINNPPSSQDSLQRIDDNVEYRYVIDSLTTITDSLSFTIDGRIREHVQQLISWNAAMPVNNYFEEILRTMDAIMFRLLLDDPMDRDLSSLEHDWVLGVAGLCPFEYGDVVYVARNIALTLLNDTTYYEDDSLCTVSESRLQIAESTPSIIKHDEPIINIYPNPFNDAINIECIHCGDAVLKYEVYSSIGVLTMQGSLNGSKLLLEGLQPGLYFIRVTDTHKFQVTKKIIKQ